MAVTRSGHRTGRRQARFVGRVPELAAGRRPAGGRPTPAVPAPAGVDVGVTEELAETGTSDFWVVFEDRADLSAASEIEDWADRGWHVYRQLTATARDSQRALRAELTERRIDHQPFWITNAVLVRDGDAATLDAARRTPGVAEVAADQAVPLPDPTPQEPAAGVTANDVEWGVAAIGADRVWEELSVRGEGVIVGTIDSGVDYTHPALVAQYLGNLGNGAFDHDYHWWDPSEVCGSPSLAPCDNNRHGTHVTGTMVGDGGAGNRIGVAPGARWIAAKGCETSSCTQAALLSSAQFMLAPTDLAGEHPRPDRRPHIVNNSWGGNPGQGNPWFDDLTDAWTAAGIFGVFSNGNDGPAVTVTLAPSADTPPGLHRGRIEVVGTTPYATVSVDVALRVPPAAACDRTVTGTHRGSLVVADGVTCLADGAHVRGAVQVRTGAGLVVGAATVTGPVLAQRPGLVTLVGADITGPVLVHGATGPVTISETRVDGPVRLVDNRAGGDLVVSGNRITGPLSCSGNQPPPVDDGWPNRVTGPRQGQCATL